VVANCGNYQCCYIR